MTLVDFLVGALALVSVLLIVSCGIGTVSGVAVVWGSSLSRLLSVWLPPVSVSSLYEF